MNVNIKCQRKVYSSEVHDIFTKETDQGLRSVFLVNDKEGRFHFVDFEQCLLGGEKEGEKKEYCDQCYSCKYRIVGCSSLYPSGETCPVYMPAKTIEWEQR